MKVLHIITRLDPGGSAENTLLTCDRMQTQGWEALLASGPGWTGEDAQVNGVSVPVILVRNMRRDPSPLADVLALIEIYRLLRLERPDIVHTHSAKAGILGRWAAFLARVPATVHTPHGHVLYGYARGVKNQLYLLAERMTAPITTCLVALSRGEMEESIAAGIGKRAQWRVIPSGVDIARIPPRPDKAENDDPLTIGTIARLEHVKGIDVLAEAAAVLSSSAKDFHVLVWGDGRQRDELVERVESLALADRFTFVGTAQPVDEFLAGLDIYVQPSRNEGMGRALVHAQAAGLPVVASSVCGIPDVVLQGRTGLLVAADDPPALAGGLERLLNHPQERKDLGAAARSWIMSHDETGHPTFSIDAMLSRLETLYRQLVDETTP